MFAPNAPLRKLVVANAKRNPENFVPPPLKLLSKKVHQVSLDWAILIARIYEVTPLVCSACGGRVKIKGFIAHKATALRILREAGWSVQFHEFDSPESFSAEDICQLITNTTDGFPEIKNQEQIILCRGNHWNGGSHNYPIYVDFESHSDPSYGSLQQNDCDPPHEAEYVDPPHE